MNTPLPVILQFRQQPGHLSESGASEIYHVKVVKAPGWGWGGPLQAMGLDAQQVRTIRSLYRNFVARTQSSEGQALGEATLHPLRLVGNQLFESLPESVQARLQQAQAISQEKQRGLELILVFESTAESLVDLPWELLHDPAGGTFFALRGGGITRRLLLPMVPKSRHSLRPQTVLGVWAEPQDIAPLAARRNYAPAPGKGEQIAWLQGPDTLRKLRQALDSGGFDSLHIVSHGRAGPNWSDFALAIENKNGRTHWLSPDQLATFISQYPEINFIYLDVCASGVSRESEAGQEITGAAGLASYLLRAGIPAAVVMQDTISQEAAGLATQTFYRELSQGKTMAEAVTDGRRAIRLQQDDPIHWSVPALYQQQQPAEEVSSVADWVLDRALQIVPPTNVLLFLLLAALVGRLSHTLAQLHLDISADWLSLPPLLFESMLLPIIAAAITCKGQQQLQEKYSLNGRTWLPFLLHKYFSALIWTLVAWMPIWLLWLGLYWSGVAGGLGDVGRQAVWALCLLGVIVAGHVGARQALRQNMLFLRVGYSLFRSSIAGFGILVAVLVLIPFLPFLFLWFVQSIWLILGGGGPPFGLALLVILILGLTLLHFAITR